MVDTMDVEIERNFFAFQSLVSGLLPAHRDWFALLRDRAIVSLHERLSEAIAEGELKFSDGHYSIQSVTDQPLDLGFFSHASDPW